MRENGAFEVIHARIATSVCFMFGILSILYCLHSLAVFEPSSRRLENLRSRSVAQADQALSGDRLKAGDRATILWLKNAMNRTNGVAKSYAKFEIVGTGLLGITLLVVSLISYGKQRTRARPIDRDL